MSGGAIATIWISDVHLGTKGCNAELLIDFTRQYRQPGDHVSGRRTSSMGWRLKKKFYWPAAHNDIVWRIMKRARRGTRVVYIPGNQRRDVPPGSPD